MSNTAPQSALPFDLRTRLAADTDHPGVYTVGSIKALTCGLPHVTVLLDMNQGLVVFEAECGCHLHVKLGAVLYALANMAQGAHSHTNTH